MSSTETAPSSPRVVTADSHTPPSVQELAELLSTFNEVTARLTATHEALQGEVAKLKSELSEANRQVERSRHLAALGEMAAGIAHEVRNPLGSIALYARMLRQDLAELPAQQSIAVKIGAAVSRLNTVVTDVLAFSRDTVVRAIEVDSAELLASAAEAARGEGPEWTNLQVRLPSPPGPSVRCDTNLLRQALVNLIRNAAEAMAAAPERTAVVTLAATTRTVRTESGNRRGMVSLSVSDSGPGIPAEVLPKLFDPFFTTRAQGTGLGLAIVHRIVDAHGGRVTVCNREEGGATFELLLPESG